MTGQPGDNKPRFGTDGWPLDGPSDAQIERNWKRAFERDVRTALNRWRAGDLTAFASAVRLCWLHRQQPPDWLVEASVTLVERAMSEDERRARREWSNHRARWEALVELRERRHELAERGDDRGTSWERAREAVAEVLEGTDARGSASTVRASYELVEAAGGEHATFESYQALLREKREN